jgi:hypothetical protein
MNPQGCAPVHPVNAISPHAFRITLMKAPFQGGIHGWALQPSPQRASLPNGKSFVRYLFLNLLVASISSIQGTALALTIRQGPKGQFLLSLVFKIPNLIA